MSLPANWDLNSMILSLMVFNVPRTAPSSSGLILIRKDRSPITIFIGISACMSRILVLTLKIPAGRRLFEVKSSSSEESNPLGKVSLIQYPVPMFLKIKSPTFIDRLSLEINQTQKSLLKAVLKDDSGAICSIMQKELGFGQQFLDWEGLNELPYGVYTLEVSQGADEMKMRLVKRI